MIVTRETLYSEFKPFERCITDETLDQLEKGAQEVFGQYTTLTIDEFFGLMDGDYSILGDTSHPSVLQIYWAKGFQSFCANFAKICERLQVPEDPNRTKLLEHGCVQLEANESVLVFVRDYFGLPSFFEAGKRTIGEYLLARKASFNAAMMRKNYEAEQRKKLTLNKEKK